MQTYMLIIILATATFAAGQVKVVPFRDSIRPRIIGGMPAALHQFPYQGLIQWANTTKSPTAPYEFIGGCSLIARRWAVSAGHCKVYNYGSYRVLFGLLKRSVTNSDVQKFAVALNDFIVHPGFAGGVTPNDIAVLKLDHAATITPAVNIVKLASDNECNALENSIVSGWGFTYSAATSLPDNLQYVTVKRISNAKCKTDMMTAGISGSFLVDSMICTANAGFTNPPKATCRGDSGGPLVLASTKRLIGVVQFGYPICGALNSPSGYTRVCSFRDNFIADHVVFN